MAKRIIRIVLEVSTLLVLLGTILFLIIYWKHIPDQVPTHFGARGEIDSWGEKRMLWILPVVNVFSYVLLTVCNAVALVANKGELPPSAGLWLSAFKLPFVAMFGYIIVCTALTQPLHGWFLPACLTVPLIPIAALVVVSLRWNAARHR